MEPAPAPAPQPAPQEPAPEPASDPAPAPVSNAAEGAKALDAPAVDTPAPTQDAAPADRADAPTQDAAPADGADAPGPVDADAPGSDAARLDQQVPPKELDTHVQEQLDVDATAEAARRDATASGGDPDVAAREVYADFYGEREVYVDPSTKRAYAATYDPATGELVGTRTKDHPLPDLPRPEDDPGNPTPDSTTATTTIHLVPGTHDARVTQEDEQVRDDGAVITTRRERSYEDDRIAEASEVEDTKTRDGREYHESRVETFDSSGAPEQVTQEWRAREDDLELTETHATSYADGVPTAKTIDRSMNIRGRIGLLGDGAGVMRQRDELSYDTQGRISGIESDYPQEDAQQFNDALNRMRPDGDGTDARFAFGRVESRPNTTDEGELSPGLVSGPGASVTHRGVNLIVEGANPSRDLPADADVDTSPEDTSALTNDERLVVAREQISETPPELLDTQNTSEAGVTVRYMTRPGETGAYAWRASDGIVFPNGNMGNSDALWHELAHDTKNPDADQAKRWEAIQRSDGEHRNQVIDALPDGTRVQAAREDLLDDNLGATSYGDQSTTEDWADSVMLYEKSRRDGGIVKAQLPDGSTRLIAFDELFPERAKLIREVHPNIDAWQAPPADPSWTDTNRFGSGHVGETTSTESVDDAADGPGHGASELGIQARDGVGELGTGARRAPAA